MKAWMSGNVAGTGTFRCTDCDYPVSLDAVDELPTCPNCGGTEFVRASLFTTAQTSVLEVAGDDDDHGWLDEIREGLHEPGSTWPTGPRARVRSPTRCSANGPGSAAAWPPTSASTTRRCRAGTR